MMPIRFARYFDLPHISSIFAESFSNEELHAYMFPHRWEFPDDYQRAWYDKVLTRWWDYSRVFIVYYEELETGAQEITGAAEWERAGEGWEMVWGRGRWDLSEFCTCSGFRFLLSGMLFQPSENLGTIPTAAGIFSGWEAQRSQAHRARMASMELTPIVQQENACPMPSLSKPSSQISPSQTELASVPPLPTLTL